MLQNKVDLSIYVNWSDFIIIHSVLVTLYYVGFLYHFWWCVSPGSFYVVFFDIKIFMSIGFKFILSWNFVVFEIFIINVLKDAMIIFNVMLLIWSRLGFKGLSINILCIWAFKRVICSLIFNHTAWWRVILPSFVGIDKLTWLSLSLL